MDLLDRAGFPKAHRIENGQKPYVDAAKLAEIEEIVRRVNREGRDIGEVIDTPPVSSPTGHSPADTPVEPAAAAG